MSGNSGTLWKSSQGPVLHAVSNLLVTVFLHKGSITCRLFLSVSLFLFYISLLVFWFVSVCVSLLSICLDTAICTLYIRVQCIYIHMHTCSYVEFHKYIGSLISLLTVYLKCHSCLVRMSSNLAFHGPLLFHTNLLHVFLQ